MKIEEANHEQCAAYDYISGIRESLQSINRFFADEDFLRSLTIIFKEAEKGIPKETTFFGLDDIVCLLIRIRWGQYLRDTMQKIPLSTNQQNGRHLAG